MRIHLAALLFVASLPLVGMEPTLPPGQFLFKFRFGQEKANAFFDNQSEDQGTILGGSPAEYSQSQFDLDMDYGWRPRVTFVARTRHLSRELESDTEGVKDSGFPWLYLGVRQMFPAPIQNGALFSEVGVSTSIDGNAERPLAIGSDSLDWTFMMGYAQDFPPREGGWRFDFGYRFRNGAPADEILVAAEMKLKLSWLGFLAAEMNVVESRKDSLVDPGPLVYPTDGGSQRLGLRFERELTARMELELGYSETISGRNQFDQDGFRLGVSYRR